jgi:NADH-quinone oxidoreductase subunit G
MLQIEIDGKKIEAEQGKMIIEVADNLGIDIPRFCYHKNLSVAANCRMCLVDVEKAPKPLPACATPVANGMKIWTTSMRARIAQKSVMEFLLINHPLDCPICDQGGECELQDLAMGYGGNLSRFCEGKRVVEDKNISHLISTDMTRCIHCTRCVRFGEEVAGIREMGAAGRGEHTKIGTFIEKNIDSEVSGNIIDLCPVGVLTSKPFRYKARAWELRQFSSIASHDCMGSNVLVHTYNDKVVRVVPRENQDINDTWLSDKDRFSYEGIYNNRLHKPSIKVDGEWHDVSWEKAIIFAVEKIQNHMKEYGNDSICGVISPNSTTEECFLFQKLIRCLGSNNIDHRTKQLDFSNQENYPTYPNIGCSLKDIEKFNSILIVGSDIHKELPLLALRIRKLSLNEGNIFSINPLNFNMNFELQKNIVPKNGNIVLYLSSILKACLEISDVNVPSEIKDILESTKISTQHKSLAKKLCSTNTHIIVGLIAQLREDSSQIISLSNLISIVSKSSIGIINFGSNSPGAWLSGCVPHRIYNGLEIESNKSGSNFRQMLDKKNNLWFLNNIETEDCSNMTKFKTNLEKSCVINLTSFDSHDARIFSDIMLPIATNYEIDGSFVNCFGVWQYFKSSVPLFENSKKSWKVIKTLANYLKLEGFKYSKIEDLQKDINVLIEKHSYKETKFKIFLPNTINNKSKNNNSYINILQNIYHSDNIVRRASSLQKTVDAKNKDFLFINEDYAKKNNLSNYDKVKIENKSGELEVSILINNNIEKNSFMAYLGTKTASIIENLDDNIVLKGIK